LAVAERVGARAWRLLRTSYSGPAWTATAFVGLTSAIATVAFIAVFVPLVAGIPLLLLALAGLVPICLALGAARLTAAVDAWRFRVLLGRDLRLRPTALRPPPAAATPAGEGHARRLPARLWAWSTSKGAWLEAGYCLLVLPLVGWVGGYLLLAAWGGGLAFLLFPAYGHALADGGRVFGLDVGYGASVAVHAALGATALLAAPWLARGVVALHLALARWLLAPSGADKLARRVTDLEQTRAGMVAAAAAERRRIERDLHDGAQQRLVAAAMTLGRAQARFADDTDAAKGLVAEAHAEMKRALAELRDLARGIHPAVLTDRGLDAALSGLAARSPVPVRIEVDVSPRAAPDVEAVAYFFVAEALTNVARHAEARQAEVTARRDGGRLVVEVVDDGRGGADETAGSGIAGLRDRARALDGAFTLDSPVGGPTTLRLELPCES
jgi:signal transduction histidine kinase